MTGPDPADAGQPENERTAQWQARAALIGFALATDITTNEALLAGVPVPRTRLKPEGLRRIGEPVNGPDFTLTADRVDELALRLDITRNGDHPDPAQLGLTVQTISDFAAVDEESATPIIGDENTCLLSHGGMLVLYGDGGAGKTTLELDLCCHLASGTNWQGIHVHGTPRILIIENEGPRGMFRKKARAKLAAWQGADIGDNILILEDPWAVFDFSKEDYRAHLCGLIVDHSIDVVAAGPINRLGVQGGGTPEEVSAFILNIELIRQQISTPLAVIFAHHENKAGDVSGAWEGVPDTLAHIRNDGNGHTTVRWQKVRWGPDLHGKTWKLNWREGETFELEEKVERTDDEIASDMVAYIADHPGSMWRPVREHLTGIQLDRLGTIRDRLLENKRIVNDGTATKMALYLPTPALTDPEDTQL